MNKIHEKTTKIDLNPIYKFAVESAKVTLSTGNSKIGRMINWSTLPGNKEHQLIAKGRIITDIPGTCSSNCNGCFKSCYARRSILQHHNSVTRSWAENTLMIRHRTEECFKEIDRQIRELNKKFCTSGNPADLRFEFFRINTSGEVQTLRELELWNDLAKKHPKIKFGIYSKNAIVLLAFFKKHGQSAENFCINVSEWNDCMKPVIEELHSMGAVFNVFHYDDSNLSSCNMTPEEKRTRQAKPHCIAVGQTAANRHPINPATGEPWKCEDCKGCYTKTGIHRYVYSH